MGVSINMPPAKIFHGPGPMNFSREVVAKASIRRSFLAAPAALATRWAKKLRWLSRVSMEQCSVRDSVRDFWDFTEIPFHCNRIRLH